ncbi:unnamed protein product [Protopolystoma xenopodis]|uniref:Uncharacterized protein n=1 Tax=Protopolystoma xenopodis TaxID=117903 RepID=A0A448XJ17_9PLAT|nr:unnamed protein product [Protopolystoma xenopodis]
MSSSTQSQDCHLVYRSCRLATPSVDAQMRLAVVRQLVQGKQEAICPSVTTMAAISAVQQIRWATPFRVSLPPSTSLLPAAQLSHSTGR